MSLTLAALAGAAHASDQPAYGQAAANTQMSVTAMVQAECAVIASPLSFGAYDPIGANRSQPLLGTAVLTVSCTKGSTVKIGLDRGHSGTGAERRMGSTRSAAGHYLLYDLFKDAGRNSQWSDASPLVWASQTQRPTTVPVFGRIGAGQLVQAGSYADTVLVTISF